jgi:hypothetical protein
VFGCISVVVDGAYFRDCRGFGLCKVGILDWSVNDVCVGERGSLVRGWEPVGREGEGWGKSG